MKDIEIMRLIEPVGGELQPVSVPPRRVMPADERDRILSKMFPRKKRG